MKQLSAQDAQFLYMENDRNLSNIAMACVYAPPARKVSTPLFDRLRSHVESRVHTSPIFKRKLVRVPLDLDFPYWADDEFFDLDAHLFRHRLSGKNRWEAFCALMGKVYSRSLDMNRPLWEMHLVENIEGIFDAPRGSFAVITKLHHAAVDGAATMQFFGCLSDRNVTGTPAWDISNGVIGAGKRPSSEDIWRQFVRNQAYSPLKMSRSLLRATSMAVPGMLTSLSKQGREQKAEVPSTRFNRRLSPAKTFNATEFSLEQFKLIQRSVEGAKINDVVLAVCSGALRRYLDQHGELPVESLVAWVPINTRDSKAKADQSSGNQVTAMITELCTQLDDPTERLRAITRETGLTKAGKSGVSARMIAEISSGLPGAPLAMASRLLTHSGATAKLCNFAVSNVPGPTEAIYMLGSRCQHQFGMTPLADGMGLFVIALSYNGKISLSLVSTREIVPDMHLLRDCMDESVAELVRAARNRKNSTGRRQGSS